MQKIEKILKRNIKKYKIEDQVKSYEVLKNWEKVLRDFLPDAVGKTMALSFEKGVLQIAAMTKEIADLIILLQKRILYALNEMLGRNLVFRISCVI